MSDHFGLLLSGSLGMGHDVMAEACAASLRKRAWETEILDSMRLLGARSGGAGERVFRGMLAVPGVYDAFHFEQLRTGGRLARLADRAASRQLVPAITERLDHRSADLVVSVFATAAGAVSRIKRRRPELRTAVFCTDVCPHRLWVHDNTDAYLVTSRTAAAFVRKFHPGADVAVVPAPVRAPFYAALAQPEARAELGIPADAHCVLLMAGAWGIGPLADVAASLAGAGVHTLAVAGRNARLEAQLRGAAERNGRLIAFGYTDRIPTLMAAADLVLTSSGDTCSEARVIGRHLLLLDVVPGHGRENLQHEVERGNADIAPSDAQGVRRSVLACLDRIGPPTASGAQTPHAWEAAFDNVLCRLGLASTTS
jgi:processive 1,2-diacylglycerol beta-glucosyltransferase